MIDACGVCDGPAANVDECPCEPAENLPGVFKLYEHGQAWDASNPGPKNEFYIKTNLPVDNTGQGFRVWGDQKHEAFIPNLSKISRDADHQEPIIAGYSKDGWKDLLDNPTVEDYAEGRPGRPGGGNSTHLRFLPTDSEARPNETRLIMCKAQILYDMVQDTGTLEYTHTIELSTEPDKQYFKEGDEVYIKSSTDTNELDQIVARGVLIATALPNHFNVVTTNADMGYEEPMSCTTNLPKPGCNQKAMIYNRNRFAVSTIDSEEDEISKFLAGHEIEITEKNGASTKTYTIKEIDKDRGLIDIEGDLGDFGGALETKLAFSHDWGETTAGHQDITIAAGQLDALPFVKNKTVPCYIKIKSSEEVASTWIPETEFNNPPPNLTHFAFDSRLEGKQWSLRHINEKDRSIFYVTPEDDTGAVSMLCSECNNDDWRLVADNDNPAPTKGPRSVVALPNAIIRTNAVDEVEYRPGNLHSDDWILNDAVDLESAEYWPYNSGYEPDPTTPAGLKTNYGKRVDYIIVSEGDLS
jgi:hypothetical protein